MRRRCAKVGIVQTNCYFLEDGGFSAVIDPGDDLEEIVSMLDGKAPSHIILTHAHFDHVGALKHLHDLYPLALIAAGEDEDMDPEHIAETAQGVLGPYFHISGLPQKLNALPKPDILLKDNDEIGPFRVLSTPGHTMGGICLYDEKDRILFSGDTLFRHSCGRTDIGGDEVILASSLKRLLSLDPGTLVLPGHEDSTTIGSEKVYFGF